jgi:hypothetical protein
VRPFAALHAHDLARLSLLLAADAAWRASPSKAYTDRTIAVGMDTLSLLCRLVALSATQEQSLAHASRERHECGEHCGGASVVAPHIRDFTVPSPESAPVGE